MTTIAVLGSANMDLVAVVDRMPQPGETVAGHRFTRGPGGKGANQALAAARAAGSGTVVRMLGAVGEDGFGSEIRGLLDQAGVDTGGLGTSAEPTGTAHITVDAAGENSIVVVPGANGTVSALTPSYKVVIADSDLLLMQFELPPTTVEQAAVWAHQHNTRVLLTPAPVRALSPALVENVDVCVCNESEAQQLSGEDDVADAAVRLVQRGIGDVVVTRGADGCLWVGEDQRPLRVPAPAVTAVDTTGAGDCFAGALSTALGSGEPMTAALRWSAAAAALSVQRPGAAGSLPARDEIAAFLVQWSWEPPSRAPR